MLNNIIFKQTTEKIILSIDVQAKDDEIIQELQEKLPKLKNFYQNANLPIKVTGKLLSEAEKTKIKEMITNEINIDVQFDETSELLGLHAIKKTFEAETDISETKYVYNSIRSGNKEEYIGSVIICGDVNSGAEVFAGGNITVLGTLRGVVHAGANGNIKAKIIANTIETTQIRIANLVKEVKDREDKCPIFHINNNTIELLKN